MASILRRHAFPACFSFDKLAHACFAPFWFIVPRQTACPATFQYLIIRPPSTNSTARQCMRNSIRMSPMALAATSAISPGAAPASPPPQAAVMTGEALVTLAAARDADAFVDLLRAELGRGRGQYRVLVLRLRDERALLQVAN